MKALSIGVAVVITVAAVAVAGILAIAAVVAIFLRACLVAIWIAVGALVTATEAIVALVILQCGWGSVGIPVSIGGQNEDSNPAGTFLLMRGTQNPHNMSWARPVSVSPLIMRRIQYTRSPP
ncbi:hypothetical protein SUNI508_06750 [Seiridium unicorne]|uniref:Uncharacterized protein n=1 Tax=Seiridium unicorne TaxID=138068 RepID=A0ABR2V017_9PEZI